MHGTSLPEADKTRVWGRARQLLEDTKRKFDPYVGIKYILDEKPRIITLEEILDIYVASSIQAGKSTERITEGMDRIARAYAYTIAKFEELAERDQSSRYRKDGETPLVAHSTRVALMHACLGGGSYQISSMLLHDVIEDCSVSLKELLKLFDKRTVAFVTLLTTPKLFNGRNGDRTWVFLASNPQRWEKITDVTGPAEYEERLRAQFREIVNTKAQGITAEMKVKAWLEKILDALDNLVSDQHLDPVRAGIRHTVLVSEIRHLEVLAPGLRKIMLALLKYRGYVVPEERQGRPVPTAKVIEYRPPEKHLDVTYLDYWPAPNSHIFVYSDDKHIKRLMKSNQFRGPIRVELPHDAPLNSAALITAFFETKGLKLKCKPGESLLPSASDAAGGIVIVKGLRNLRKFGEFMQGLEEFCDRLHDLCDGKGIMP